jgi:hypothetical protein
MLAHHGRYDYSALPERPVYDWPGGRRLAVYLAVNVEHFAFGEFPGNDFTAIRAAPYHRGYAWRDYGNRVGVWRLLDLLDRLELPAAVNLNSSVYDHCPQVVAAFRRRGDEVVAHGRTNSEAQATMDERTERELIAEVTAAITRHEGAPPAGWLGPWISQSPITLELLVEAGYRYMLDWPLDDQPVWFRARGGRILSVPYPSMEVNDSPALVYRGVADSVFADMIVDDLDEKLALSEQAPLVCPLALHTYLVGQPLRLPSAICAGRSSTWRPCATASG